jgi:hypothetical protein
MKEIAIRVVRREDRFSCEHVHIDYLKCPSRGGGEPEPTCRAELESICRVYIEADQVIHRPQSPISTFLKRS